MIRILTVAIAIGVGSCSLQQINQNLDRVCDPGATTCTSLSAFQANLDHALQGKVVGYVSVIGGLPQPVAWGNARRAQDGKQAWTVDTPINVMSISKLVTTIGVLQVMAKHNILLTDKLSAYLPPDWKAAQGPNIGLITFQDLLTHRSGFRDGPSADTSYAKLKQQITDGVTTANHGQPSYNNLNFAIFRVVMPAMDGAADPGAATRDQVTAAWYVDYIRSHVLAPVADTGDCKPTGGAHQGLWYPSSPPASVHGNDGGDWTSLCGGGGWNLTAGDLYRVALSLSADERLLSTAQKATMNSQCLGWDCSVGTQTDFVGKNGLWSDGQGGVVQTFLGLFHGTRIQVVLIINSPPPGNITSIVSTAYQAAKVPNP